VNKPKWEVEIERGREREREGERGREGEREGDGRNGGGGREECIVVHDVRVDVYVYM